MTNRDRCWLIKEVELSNLKTFSIESNDKISQTIIEEMPQLFKEIELSDEFSDIQFKIIKNDDLGLEGFRIEQINNKYEISAQTEKGLLYGMFELHRQIVSAQKTPETYQSVPDQHFRMINHWDNLDGTIERGYAGDSIFYKNNEFRCDFEMVREYARLLASVGINAISINNVNVRGVAAELILEKNHPNVKMLNDIFASYGIKTFISINFASPKILGNLDTADPLDEGVVGFWKDIVKKIYRSIPDFGGFVVKADSEGEPGPFAYNRGHDDGANMFGDVLSPYGGICIWRCFVYNSTQDWRDRSIDRARAAYDHFMPLDGKFKDNVILQIKLGALDFQVKEPVSPLFGGLKKTNHIIEFQLTQEYTGQQKAIYYQAPVWKEALDFDTKQNGSHSIVKDLLKHNSAISGMSGICAVGVVGMDNNWTGHKLMQSNIFAYGKLSWNNNLTSEEIINEWLELTFSLSVEKYQILKEILLTSRETYQLYNAPNGVGFMCRPNHHYGPDIDGYEYDRWGTYHFADRDGIGVDRSLNGTKYVQQYSEEVCKYYDNLATCPDDLLLWFHHVPYAHKLLNGKTLIQNIYDTHFLGVERVEKYQREWQGFSDEVSLEDFENVTTLLEEQLRVAIEWRDQINTYFYRKSGIRDEKNRQVYF